MTDEQEKKLRHMLGAVPGRYRKNQWGFRNYYCASKGGQDHTDLQQMAADGLVSQGHVGEKTIYFHATEAGCKAIGLTKAQIDRAFDRQIKLNDIRARS